jgi:hypothetical protein
MRLLEDRRRGCTLTCCACTPRLRRFCRHFAQLLNSAEPAATRVKPLLHLLDGSLLSRPLLSASLKVLQTQEFCVVACYEVLPSSESGVHRLEFGLLSACSCCGLVPCSCCCGLVVCDRLPLKEAAKPLHVLRMYLFYTALLHIVQAQMLIT